MHFDQPDQSNKSQWLIYTLTVRMGETCVKFYFKLEQKLIKFVISLHVPHCTDRHFMAASHSIATYSLWHVAKDHAIWSPNAKQRTIQSLVWHKTFPNETKRERESAKETRRGKCRIASNKTTMWKNIYTVLQNEPDVHRINHLTRVLYDLMAANMYRRKPIEANS